MYHEKLLDPTKDFLVSTNSLCHCCRCEKNATFYWTQSSSVSLVEYCSFELDRYLFALFIHATISENGGIKKISPQ